jgi:hypothetical protein
MKPSFQIPGLPLETFAGLFSLSEAELAKRGARRVIADAKPGFPCRVSLVDAKPGERLILLPFAHHDVNSPYRSSGPIFVRESAEEAALGSDEIPEVVSTRLMSVRAYDATGMMIAAKVTDGSQIKAQIAQFFADSRIRYLHLHNAGAGCYSCSVERIA